MVGGLESPEDAAAEQGHVKEGLYNGVQVARVALVYQARGEDNGGGAGGDAGGSGDGGY